MRKLIALLLVLGLAVFSGNFVYAQDGDTDTTATEQMEDTTTAAEAEVDPIEPEAPVDEAGEEEAGAEQSGYQVLKKYFIDGDWRFMSFVLVCLILGLAFCIERIITLNIATTNTDKLLARIDEHLKSGDVQGAMEVCKSTQGPTASILYEGLKNADDGAEAVEKAIVSYGSVQMGLLERGLVWISLFIAIAPMLGFMGTVIGMIQAFDRIEAVGDLSPSVVAGGIKVALLTTVFGLITAIILQIFYNYIVSKIDGIVNKMEDASIALVDIMASNNIFKQ
ncbi:MotA/TolQ/ExbB proton channel family protein [Phaeodactylibacter sp.]|jgi:biopolymer transport protein ExbB|uniref:MotA/TolQ/ExbB proton channel family protein n=1 Tax=Phaeodactylibacter sp. TaxID=1940289 RepID=UPI0025D39B86|nr:MotA/TolQ/ExbB proton channel family protein [Phaeodactylibacter sp.]MCI4651560.1 MotA/TolQ/ExbB proton channel family protein [Phaeodactylibacter sp.]MCI5092537.1 MotA/TolQ/ExbB proton channel family protein [Phaeodactylibacter sp.]